MVRRPTFVRLLEYVSGGCWVEDEEDLRARCADVAEMCVLNADECVMVASWLEKHATAFRTVGKGKKKGGA